ncbi:calponin homology domain-containing protein [Chytriomyces cf. hyalinus JEL632]|nr:calponin homology domain-containing protein [Chytriomyces cf. hyalinus JEL632]
MAESRTELLAWVNDLCQVSYTKIEQCGTGAVHCAIMDSIYRDVPLAKVKFAAKQEYEYVNNFKVLQAVFDKHKIDNAIPVERLMKCKFQDNLEFMQWMKKYWDQYFPGGAYDALARRGAQAGSKAAAAAVRANVVPLKKAVSSGLASGAGPGRNPAIAPAAFGAAKTSSDHVKKMDEITIQNTELKNMVEQAEKERNFYFDKLREIEGYVGEMLTNGTNPTTDSLTHIQSIMYKTEDGFVPPSDADETETF